MAHLDQPRLLPPSTFESSPQPSLLPALPTLSSGLLPWGLPGLPGAGDSAQPSGFLSGQPSGALGGQPSGHPSGEPDPWRAFSRATNDLFELRLENHRLKQEQKNRLTEKSDSIFNPPQHAIDDVITRQALEISQLRQNLESTKLETESTKERLGTRLTVKDEQITYLEARLKDFETVHKNELSDLQLDKNKLTSEFNAKVRELEEKNRLQKSVHLQSKEELNAEISNLQRDIREKKAEVTSSREKMDQMKVYLTEIETDDGESWKKEKQNLEIMMKELSATKDVLENNNKLLKVRLDSMNEILTLQEKELSKTKSDLIDPVQQGLPLLTRWREKVFALLVQLKSAEITSDKDVTNFNIQMADYDNRLDARSRDLEVLGHVIRDREAELQIEKNQCKTMEAELTRVQQLALMLDDQSQRDRETCHKLLEFVNTLTEQFSLVEERYNDCKSSMKSYNQRIRFASNRLIMLQGQFARREARLRLQCTVDQSETSLEQKPETDITLFDETTRDNLGEELSRVTSERDQLIQQMKEDSIMIEERLQQPKLQLEKETGQLRQEIEDLERLMVEKNELVDQQTIELTHAQQQLTESRQTVQEMQDDRQLFEEEMKQALDDQETRLNHLHQTEMTDLDRKLQETKRDYMKTVVSLRQLERQSQREKDRLSELTHTMEETYLHDMEKLQRYTQHLEKERNIIMTTLRQEGLIGRLRQQPITESDDVIAADIQYEASSNNDVIPSDNDVISTSKRNADMKSVLDDLELLTADDHDVTSVIHDHVTSDQDDVTLDVTARDVDVNDDVIDVSHADNVSRELRDLMSRDNNNDDDDVVVVYGEESLENVLNNNN